MSKRILFLSFFYPPDLSAGSFRSVALIKALLAQVSADVHIDVLTTQPNRYQSFKRDTEYCETDAGLSIYRVPLAGHSGGARAQAWSFLCFAWAVCLFVRGRQYDLVYATSSRLMTATLGALVATAKGARLYLDIRDIFVETLQGVFTSLVWRPAVWLFSLIERWTIRRADIVNLVSPGFWPYFHSRYPNIRFSVFSNGVDCEFTHPLIDTPVTLAPGEPLRVVYAGNIGEGQGLQHILPALALRLAGRVQFQIVGDGNCALELRNALLQHDLNNVEWLDPVPRKKLKVLYQQADVLFLHLNDVPAFRRVLPSKLFEYAATGKPIWAGVCGYAKSFTLREVDNAAIFSPCDVEQAVRAFDDLILESVDRSAFVERYSRDIIMSKMACELCLLMGVVVK